MSLQESIVVPLQSQDVKRPLANYPPSFWGDRFLNYHFDHNAHASKEREAEKLIEEVRKELLEAMEDQDHPLKHINLIDQIQRLCVAHHFEAEITQSLDRLYHSDHDGDDDDLFGVSLRFRLLRQQGYTISPEIFNKFKDDNGNFKDCLSKDVRGMLGLYDASQLRIRGEDILEEALVFSKAQLKKSIDTGVISENVSLAAQVSHALKQQMLKNIPRLEAKHYMMSVYPEIASQSKLLLELAKLEFNMLQSIHQKELSNLSRYWKKLGLAEKSYFARDRLVECFFWSVASYPGPENCLARRILTKTIAITTVIDDVYDAFGLIDELKIYTDAIERWDMSCVDQLPELMKPSYEALLELFEEINNEMEKQGTKYRLPHAIEAMKYLFRGYLKEAQWFNQKYIPTLEEHRELSLITCTYHTLITLAYVGMGEIVSAETFDWMLTKPKIIEASSIVSRFMDDIVGHKFEQKRGHPASGIECYVKHNESSEEEAYEVFTELINNAWKDLNEELFLKKAMPKPILEVAFNFARVMDVLYKFEDSFTLVGEALINTITSMFIDPVP